MSADPQLFPAPSDNELQSLQKINWLAVQMAWVQAPPPDPAWMPELTDNGNLSLQKINGLLYSIVAAGGLGVLVGPLSLLPVIFLLNRNYRQRGDL